MFLSKETGSNLARVLDSKETPSAKQVFSIIDFTSISACFNFWSSVLRKSIVINASFAITLTKPGLSFVTPTVPI